MKNFSSVFSKRPGKKQPAGENTGSDPSVALPKVGGHPAGEDATPSGKNGVSPEKDRPLPEKSGDMPQQAGGAKAGAAGVFRALKRFAGKHRKLLLLIVIILIILAVALKFLSGRNSGTAQTQYIESEVTRHTITSTLSGSGTLQPANSYTVTTLMEGDILTDSFEEGDMVEKDSVLYTLDSSDVSTNIEQAQIALEQAQRGYDSAADSLSVEAAISGELYSLSVDVGDQVTQGQELAVIRESDTMTLTVPFPADDAQNFYVGQTASVTLDGSFETLTGTVKSVSGSNIVGTGNSITRNVKISVKNPGGLSDTQSATARINGISCASSGTFTYAAESTVTSAVSGTVTAVNAQEGSSVYKDQTILTLGGDNLEEQIQTARDSLRNAELSMSNARDQLDNYTITSPISGTVVDKQSKAGDVASSGETMCTIYDLSYLELTLDIDELDISQVSEGLTVQITADAVEDKTYTGVITKVSVASSSGTASSGGTSVAASAAASGSSVSTYPVTIQIDETEGLLPGMNVDAVITLDEAEDVIAVPNAAVSRGSQILISEDSASAVNAAGREAPEGYVYVEVETGISDDDYTQILSGLSEGDTVAYLQSLPDSGSGESEMPAGMSGDIPGGDMPGGGMPGGIGGSGGMPGGMSGGPMG